ncbi:MAG: sigma-70 family RNA polymerase sigma factor [Planctomycetes bacterium]|nr:sigma-70 family RNA polymerase sigma factor [Planctomycetota bacterium]
MNEALLRTVHRAIRSDRSALRSLVDRYQGFAYAVAYRQTKSFPQAQRLVVAGWVEAARRLPRLAEPERFARLLEDAIADTHKAMPKDAPVESAEENEPHSILRTEKVQARRALRQALAACPLPESPVFFLKFVEGLTLEQIAELYGVEKPAVVASMRKVCVDLAFRAGYATGMEGQAPPEPETLSPERRELLGAAVEIAEGSLAPNLQRDLERSIQTHAEFRKDHEAVQQVLEQATRTFAAHRLPQDFIKEILLAIPYSGPGRGPETDAPGPAQGYSSAYGQNVPPAAPPVYLQDLPLGPSLILGLVGALMGLLFSVWIVSSAWNSKWAIDNFQGFGDGAIALNAVQILLGAGGALLLLFARPPFLRAVAPLPPWYYGCYGILVGAFLALLFADAAWNDAILQGVVGPLWLVAAFALLELRRRMERQEFEARTEARLRRLEKGGYIPPQPTPVPTPTPQQQG